MYTKQQLDFNEAVLLFTLLVTNPELWTDEMKKLDFKIRYEESNFSPRRYLRLLNYTNEMVEL